MEKKKATRHGMRQPGKTQTSITLSDDVLERARQLAAEEDRSLSNWLERLVKSKLLESGLLPPELRVGEEPGEYGGKKDKE